ncbi:unnamed protein product [Penicillium olsonii]|nr:unnamed protein product [Penicillium olsonii]
MLSAASSLFRRRAGRDPATESHYEVPLYTNAAYYPNWRIYRKEPPSSLRLGFISHVFYAFAWVREDGTVYLSDEWADTQMPVDGTEGCLRAFAQLKQQYSKMRVVLSVGGGGKGSENFAEVSNSRSKTDTFVRTARGLVDQFGIDGIDSEIPSSRPKDNRRKLEYLLTIFTVDWEHPSNSKQGKDYVRLLARLREALPAPRYVLTTALPAGQWALKNIDLSAAAKYLDMINLMTYDFAGPWAPETGHQAQLYGSAVSGDSSVSYVLSQGVSRRKIILGVPVYGRSFLGSNGPGQRYTGNGGEEGVFDYRDLPRPGTQEYHDPRIGAGSCVGADGGFVTYDTPGTVKQKAEFVTSEKLGGLFYWHVCSDARGPRSLIETGYNTLHEMLGYMRFASFQATCTMPTTQPATADSGYITEPVSLENTYTSDPSLQRTLEWYLPSATLQSVRPHLTQLGAEAISERVREWSGDAERNVPYVKSHNVWGKRYDYDRLITTEGWKQLGKWGARNKIVSAGYDQSLGVDRRTVQYALNYLYSPSSGLYSCPISMTDGAAFILSSRISSLPSDHSFHAAFQGLISEKDDHWTSGQWMTERAGGSDVQNTETWATYSPLANPGSDPLGDGDYLISGFKFFSSATDANLALLLAKTPSGKLSTFLAPLRRTVVGADGVTKVVSNGVRIHRLKNKLGTKELPTAELELKDMRAHLIGELDQGVVTIAPLLNVTRVHTFVGSLGGWRRAISITKSFAKARTTVGEPLWLIPMHLRLLADLEVKHRGAMNLAWLTVTLFGVVEDNKSSSSKLAHIPQPGKEANVIFRTLAATAKAVISKMATLGIQECQESMGGVGYMDEADEPEFNISRILRNNAVNSIWEGTTNVLASEVVRFLLKNDNLKVFSVWVERMLSLIQTPSLLGTLKTAWSTLRARFTSQDPASTVADGRRFMFTLAWILSGALLALDAERDQDPTTTEIARRWVLCAEGGVGDQVFHDIVAKKRSVEASSGEEHLQWDCRIAWGVDLPAGRASGHRSLQKASSKL